MKSSRATRLLVFLCIVLPTFAHAQVDDKPQDLKDAKNEAPEIAHRMKVRILDEGEVPVEKATLVLRVGNKRTALTPDDKHRIVVELTEKDSQYFTLYARAPGRVWMRARWDSRKQKEDLPNDFTFHLPKGTRIRGVVLDAEGNPIEGATVSLNVIGPDTGEHALAAVSDKKRRPTRTDCGNHGMPPRRLRSVTCPCNIRTLLVTRTFTRLLKMIW